jgi:peptidoglycan/xylan/chitin deacetylase (PgdA/CDA1 family)
MWPFRLGAAACATFSSLLLAGEARPLGGDDDGTLGLFGGRDERVLYELHLVEPLVALTIDDGPDPASTPAILDVLRDHDAHATFFLISSRIPGNEALIRRIVDEGHELGNHMTRDEPSIALEPDVFEARLLEASATLRTYAPVRWFRPGSGYYDDEMLDILERHGLRCALGSVYPLDAQLPWRWSARTWIRWRARPGAVIILHDGGGRGERTADVLARALPELAARGLRAVTLSELTHTAARQAPLRASEHPLLR